MGAKMVPFAGWDMPVWYTSVVEEHLATRQAAGLFDVTHMGVYDVRGPDAASFLDSVCGNDCGGLMPGESLYTHFLTPDADVVDDTLVYRRGFDNYLVVVNASNDDKDRTWLESVRDGKVRIDNARPWARTYGYEARIRNLRDPKSGDDMRVDIALQGPRSRDILLALGVDELTRARILKLKRTELCDAVSRGLRLDRVAHGLHRREAGLRALCAPGPRGRFLDLAPARRGPVWHQARRPWRPRLASHGGRAATVWARDGRRLRQGWSPRPRRRRRRIRLLRQGLQAVVHRSRGLHRPRASSARVSSCASASTTSASAWRTTAIRSWIRTAKSLGWVTSCAVDAERFLTGQAYLDLAHAVEGTPIFIHQGGVMDRPATPAKVVSRFPKL